jgi:uncharacterized membrane protein YqhA
MDLRRLERRAIVGSRFLAAMAVVGSLAGSLLMFVIGLVSVVEAYVHWLPPHTPGEEVRPTAAATLGVIEALDRFLIAIVLLYFSYGVYSLFIHPEQPEEELALPSWLRVGQIGQLKQVVAEVIIVILFVLFLRTTLHAFEQPRTVLSFEQIASLVVLPVCAALLAFALWLVQLHPKTPAERAESGEGKPVSRPTSPTHTP